MKEKFQYFLAVLVAALWSDIFNPSTWRKAWLLFTLWFGSYGAKASVELQVKRRIACNLCPIHYRKLDTCGSPFDKDTKGLGCWCHCATMIRYEGSTCWLDDKVQDAEFGWKEY